MINSIRLERLAPEAITAIRSLSKKSGLNTDIRSLDQRTCANFAASAASRSFQLRPKIKRFADHVSVHESGDGPNRRFVRRNEIIAPGAKADSPVDGVNRSKMDPELFSHLLKRTRCVRNLMLGKPKNSGFRYCRSPMALSQQFVRPPLSDKPNPRRFMRFEKSAVPSQPDGAS
jgi:hypothetical protein